METKIFDITVIGHFSIDSIYLPHKKNAIPSMGGAATYVSIASRRLGRKVALISKIGGDFPEKYLESIEKEGINLSWITKNKEEKTTQFEIKYNKSLTQRTMKLNYKATPINSNNLPKNFSSKITHLAPISDEISYEIAKRIKRNTSTLSIDPQGLIRKFSKNGNVTLSLNPKTEILSLVDIFKSSFMEIKSLTGLSNLKEAINAIHDFGIKIVIVTFGSRGAIISDCGTKYSIPACKSRGLIDPTGAGDCFIGGFLAEFAIKKNIVWCACVGSASASFVIEKVGSTFFGEKEEIYQRAYAIYEKDKNRF